MGRKKKKKWGGEELKKSKVGINKEFLMMDTLLFTANHSFKSSLSGSLTASFKFPDPRVLFAAL